MITKAIEAVKTIVRKIKDPASCGKARSAEWPKVRNAYLKEHPACELCGSTHKLNIHHRKPFHLHPELELDPKNFITLCEGKEFGINDHCNIGHGDNFKFENIEIDSDVKKAKEIIKNNGGKPSKECTKDLSDFAGIVKARVKKENTK